MGFENGSVEMLKPEPKYVNTTKSPYLDFINEYKNELITYIQARDSIEEYYRKIGISDEKVEKSLARLNSSIDKLQQGIEDFEARYSSN